MLLTKMFLPVGSNAIALAGSFSLRGCLSGSLSPALAGWVARSADACAWAVWAAPVVRLEMIDAMDQNGLVPIAR